MSCRIWSIRSPRLPTAPGNSCRWSELNNSWLLEQSRDKPGATRLIWSAPLTGSIEV